MKYQLEVNNKKRAINSITEILNNDDCVILIADFTVKRPEMYEMRDSDGWITFFIGANMEDIGEIKVMDFENMLHYAEIGRYSLTIILVKDDESKRKTVWES